MDLGSTVGKNVEQTILNWLSVKTFLDKNWCVNNNFSLKLVLKEGPGCQLSSIDSRRMRMARLVRT